MSTAHLRGPVKGLSSYDKICSHLVHTQDFSDYADLAFKVLDNANVAGWEFEPGGDDYEQDPNKKRNVAPPRWRLLIDWGKTHDGQDNIEKVFGGNDLSGIHKWELGLARVCTEKDLNQIVQRNFNTDRCPTYFCKKTKLLGQDKDGARSSKLENLWVNYARKHLQEQLADKIVRTQEKIRLALQDAYDSPQFAQEKIVFHERCIADEIKLVLLKFSGVAKPHVLKMALDEFVCHAIMES
jgi:hypothetical protein